MSFGQPVAIVGIGGVFPQAPTLERFWRNINDGYDAVSDVPDSHWRLDGAAVLDESGVAPDKVYSTRGCFIQDFRFDPSGLDIDVDWLNQLDVVNHYTLHAGYQAFQDAVIDPVDRSRFGVIIGNIALPTDKSSALAEESLGAAFLEKLPFSTPSYGATRTAPINRYVTGLPAGLLSKALALSGGSYTLDAACASSLYAVKLAVNELLSGRADAMITGGVNGADSLYTQMGFAQLHALSPSGRCSPFDKKGDGLIVGQGAGMMVLKRLDDAVAHGDRIYGVIHGIGLSNDIEGNLLAPSSEGQLRAMRPAYEACGWHPGDIDLIECHATGTQLGDRVEFESLTALWESESRRPDKTILGSVKSNVGHLLTGAGAAGLLKLLLALKNKTLPPTANFESANSSINLADSPFDVLSEARPWPSRKNSPRRAAVNAFGFGGINAHVLLEEWIPKKKRNVVAVKEPDANTGAGDIAIVGMGISVGSLTNLDDFRDFIIRSESKPKVTGDRRWWGVPQSNWYQAHNHNGSTVNGFFVSDIEVPIGKYRIPPAELQGMLPQQLLMLQVASAALADAGYSSDAGLRTGVYIGLGLDLCTTNFHLRWSMANLARQLVDSGQLKLAEADLQDWILKLRDAAGPPLSADRTMGALGGIVASRIAREFRVGGPSHTVSSEENSGIHALQVGIRALQEQTIDQAFIGAVDLSGDIRSLLNTDAGRPFSASGIVAPFSEKADGTVPGEGAAGVVLKRVEDAVKDGDKIYAIVRGVGQGNGGAVPELVPSKAAFRRALERAYSESGVDPDSVELLETHGSGYREEDDVEAAAIRDFFKLEVRGRPLYLNSIKPDVGHTGAAAGLVSIVKTATALADNYIPAMRNLHWSESRIRGDSLMIPESSQFWLRNREDGPRRAGVNCISMDGNSTHVILEAYESSADRTTAICHDRDAGTECEELFVFDGDRPDELLSKLGAMRALIESDKSGDFYKLANQWFDERRDGAKKKLGGVLIAKDAEHLGKLIATAQQSIRSGDPRSNIEETIFLSSNPVGGAGELAYVFPGSGNHYHGMGRSLMLGWPEVFATLDSENMYLRDQFVPELFWHDRPGVEVPDQYKAIIMGQAFLGTGVHEVLSTYGLRPDAVVGYSLGESVGMFALKAWGKRDRIMERMNRSTLFTSDLVGRCDAARKAWNVRPGAVPKWVAGVISCTAKAVTAALSKYPRAYLMIINTPEECVIGGHADDVGKLVDELGCTFHAIHGVPTVHCDIAKIVEKEYWTLHNLRITAPKNTRYYSMAWAKSYKLTKKSVADSITAQAVSTVDFSAVVEQAYDDGIRFFVEVGPGNSCTRMISNILSKRPHAARAVCVPGQNDVASIKRLLAHLVTERVSVDLSSLYRRPKRADSRRLEETEGLSRSITVATDGGPFEVPLPPIGEMTDPDMISQFIPDSPTLVAQQPAIKSPVDSELVEQMKATSAALAESHRQYLAFTEQMTQSISDNLEQQMRLIGELSSSGGSIDPVSSTAHLHSRMSVGTNVLPRPQFPVVTVPAPVETGIKTAAATAPPALNREQCLEFGIGKVGDVLGPEFAEIDNHPTRVRLPDEPLMLVDRILEIDADVRSMTSGRVVTEHDILADKWYLDNGRIPTCIAVEAGQADLFLSGYLGIDFETKGLAVYRLLDADVAFHGPLPGPGEVIHYDIRIDSFFRQGDTYLFRFNFDGTVSGRPLITMRNGCAGFFTQEELDAGKGVVHRPIDEEHVPGKLPDLWHDLVPMAEESYSDAQIGALRDGDLVGCFGPAFNGLPLTNPLTLPSGRMKLVDRVLSLEPKGGRFGIGRICAEADIHPDDWFLTCHFVDDKVMPGTLMYECCLHTLRIFLLRMGWVADANEFVYEPVVGVKSQLKCRGQVLETTKRVEYEIVIKEMGYNPAPYAIADAFMYSDDKRTVKIGDMSIQLTGLTLERILSIWDQRTCALEPGRDGVFTFEQILAFAVGKPSVAFGDRYKVFDEERSIARLPGPPYQFMHRVMEVTGEQWKMASGGTVVAEYDVPTEAWYFRDHRFGMPYSVLLEVGLQVCGWLSSYVGSALVGDDDVRYRNLGGEAVQLQEVNEDCGRLTTHIKMTSASPSGGMIIQHFEYDVRNSKGSVYKGTTYFGFFTHSALKDQVGIREAKPYAPTKAEVKRGRSFPYPTGYPYPQDMMRMVADIALFVEDGGPHGLGFIRGTKKVNPSDWFFKAHFYKDPVWPGSLGLESFLQLLEVVAVERWGGAKTKRLQAMALGEKHSWVYRGQILPVDDQVTVEAVITEIDEDKKIVRADGFLIVDGRVIYQMINYTLQYE